MKRGEGECRERKRTIEPVDCCPPAIHTGVSSVGEKDNISDIGSVRGDFLINITVSLSQISYLRALLLCVQKRTYTMVHSNNSRTSVLSVYFINL